MLNVINLTITLNLLGFGFSIKITTKIYAHSIEKAYLVIHFISIVHAKEFTIINEH